MKKSIYATVGITALLAGSAGILIGRQGATPPTASRSGAADTARATQPTAADEIEVTPAQLKSAGIELTKPHMAQLSPSVEATATIAAQVDAEAVLAARAAGTVIRLYKRLGDPVKRGETVALIESQEASGIAAARQTARARLAVARKTLAREERLYDEGVTARQDYETAQAEFAAAKAEAERTVAAARAAGVSSSGTSVAVTSPTSGRVTAAPVALGSVVAAGAEIYRVVDPDDIEIRAELPAPDAARVVSGGIASVDLENADSIKARVRAVAPSADPQSQTSTVVMTPLAGNRAIRPGQSGTAAIPVGNGQAQAMISVPEEAVQFVNGTESVFVRTKDGFRVQPVRTGASSGGRIQILSGLDVGDVVAGRNAFLLKAQLSSGSGDGDDQ